MATTLCTLEKRKLDSELKEATLIMKEVIELSDALAEVRALQVQVRKAMEEKLSELKDQERRLEDHLTSAKGRLRESRDRFP